MAAPTVIVLRDRAGMGAMVPAWEDLAANALEANPFYEPWILLPALWARGEEGFECVSVWDEGKLIGLFPFERRASFKRLPVATLTAWRHSAYLLCTPILRAADEHAALLALIRWDVDQAAETVVLYLPALGS